MLRRIRMRDDVHGGDGVLHEQKLEWSSEYFVCSHNVSDSFPSPMASASPF